MRKLETIFGELLKLVPRYQFEKAVEQYQGDRYVKSYTTWHQYITILFSQIKQKDSIRDIVTGWATFESRWYHLGMKEVCRSTFSDAHNRRDYQIFESLFYHLLSRCKQHTPKHRFKFKNPLFSLDASVIDLCLSVFPWAKFRKAKGAIKMHRLYDHSGALPSFVTITDGKKHDVTVAKKTDLPLSPDGIVSIDRAYIDFKWLNSLENSWGRRT